jgi:hypothetical protein
MTQTHAPGPWENNGCGLIFGPPLGGDDADESAWDSVLVCYVDSESLDPDTIEANANLIAAAPELLEALDNLAEHIDSKSGDFAMRAHFLKEAFAAIAKARGQA